MTTYPWLEDTSEIDIELMKQAFASPGGKRAIAKRLNKLIPKHETYVEPYAGGAAVYFNKDPATSKQEILNDLNASIANSYKYIKESGEGDASRLETLVRAPSEREFYRIKDKLDKEPAPATIEGFADFFRLTSYSFGADRMSYGHHQRKYSIADKLPGLKERLKNTEIENKDAIQCIKDHDSPTTFYYIDPPYPGSWKDKYKQGYDHIEQLLDCLKAIKGKFLLSLGKDAQIVKMFKDKDIKVRRIKTARSCNKRDKDAKTEDYEYIASNFDDFMMMQLEEDEISVIELATDEPFKPYKLMQPGATYTKLDVVLKALEPGIPYLGEPSIPGEQAVLYKQEKKHLLRDKNGKDITTNNPQIIKAAKDLSNYNYTIEGRIGLWEDGKTPRFNVEDITLYDEKDTKELEYYERRKLLEQLKYNDTITTTPGVPLTRDTIKASLERLANYPGSEGAMIRKANSTYIEGPAKNHYMYLPSGRKELSDSLRATINSLASTHTTVSVKQLTDIAQKTLDTENMYWRPEIAQSCNLSEATVYKYQKLMRLL
jgi:site-specific DNA-adenine methylase